MKKRQIEANKPIKQHDHACDALRYFVYTILNKSRGIKLQSVKGLLMTEEVSRPNTESKIREFVDLLGNRVFYCDKTQRLTNAWWINTLISIGN